MTQWMSGASVPWRAAKVPPMALRQPGLRKRAVASPGARSVGDDVYHHQSATFTIGTIMCAIWSKYRLFMVVYGCFPYWRIVVNPCQSVRGSHGFTRKVDRAHEGTL